MEKKFNAKNLSDHPIVNQDAEENVWDADDTIDADDIFKVDAGDADWDNEEKEEGEDGDGAADDNRGGNWR